MQFKAYNRIQSQEIIELFNAVFSASEGQKEGQIIGQLVKELLNTTDSNKLFGYISTSDDRITGCIFFTPLTLPSGKVAFILSPVAVSTSEQGKGIGQQLINFGIQQIRKHGAELLFTYGDPDFYSKVGFIKISEDLIKAPLKLSFPEGWLALSLNNQQITSETGPAKCVEALNKQEYW